MIIFFIVFLALFGAVYLSVYCLLKGKFIDEIYLAVPGTGLITSLVAYIFSHYARKKLMEIAHLAEEAK